MTYFTEIVAALRHNLLQLQIVYKDRTVPSERSGATDAVTGGAKQDYKLLSEIIQTCSPAD